MPDIVVLQTDVGTIAVDVTAAGAVDTITQITGPVIVDTVDGGTVELFANELTQSVDVNAVTVPVLEISTATTADIALTAGVGTQGVQGLPGTQGLQGTQGLPGLQGVLGPVGPPGTGAHFTHYQQVPSALWVIHHGLNTYPATVVLDSSQREVFGDITFVDTDNVTIAFAVDVVGTANLTS